MESASSPIRASALNPTGNGSIAQARGSIPQLIAARSIGGIPYNGSGFTGVGRKLSCSASSWKAKSRHSSSSATQSSSSDSSEQSRLTPDPLPSNHQSHSSLSIYKAAFGQRDLDELCEDRAARFKLHEVNCDLPYYVRSTFLMTFSPDGTRVASTHGDHRIYICDVRTGKQIMTLQGHQRTPWCIAWHPSNKSILASGCLAGEVRIWDLLTKACEVWTTPHNSVIASLSFHPADHVLAIGTCNEIHFWDWSRAEPFASASTSSEKEKVRFVRFDSTGTKLITGISNMPKMTSCDTLQSRILDGYGIPSQNFTPATSGAGGGPGSASLSSNGQNGPLSSGTSLGIIFPPPVSNPSSSSSSSTAYFGLPWTPIGQISLNRSHHPYLHHPSIQRYSGSTGAGDGSSSTPGGSSSFVQDRESLIQRRNSLLSRVVSMYRHLEGLEEIARSSSPYTSPTTTTTSDMQSGSNAPSQESSSSSSSESQTRSQRPMTVVSNPEQILNSTRNIFRRVSEGLDEVSRSVTIAGNFESVESVFQNEFMETVPIVRELNPEYDPRSTASSSASASASNNSSTIGRNMGRNSERGDSPTRSLASNHYRRLINMRQTLEGRLREARNYSRIIREGQPRSNDDMSNGRQSGSSSPTAEESSSVSNSLINTHRRLHNLCTRLQQLMQSQQQLEREQVSSSSPFDARYRRNNPFIDPPPQPPPSTLSSRSGSANGTSTNSGTAINEDDAGPDSMFNLLTRLQQSLQNMSSAALTTAIAAEHIQQVRLRVTEILDRLSNVSGYRNRLANLREQIYLVAERVINSGVNIVPETDSRIDLLHCLYLVDISIRLTQQMQRILAADYRLTQISLNPELVNSSANPPGNPSGHSLMFNDAQNVLSSLRTRLSTSAISSRTNTFPSTSRPRMSSNPCLSDIAPPDGASASNSDNPIDLSENSSRSSLHVRVTRNMDNPSSSNSQPSSSTNSNERGHRTLPMFFRLSRKRPCPSSSNEGNDADNPPPPPPPSQPQRVEGSSPQRRRIVLNSQVAENSSTDMEVNDQPNEPLSSSSSSASSTPPSSDQAASGVQVTFTPINFHSPPEIGREESQAQVNPRRIITSSRDAPLLRQELRSQSPDVDEQGDRSRSAPRAVFANRFSIPDVRVQESDSDSETNEPIFRPPLVRPRSPPLNEIQRALRQLQELPAVRQLHGMNSMRPNSDQGDRSGASPATANSNNGSTPSSAPGSSQRQSAYRVPPSASWHEIGMGAFPRSAGAPPPSDASLNFDRLFHRVPGHIPVPPHIPPPQHIWFGIGGSTIPSSWSVIPGHSNYRIQCWDFSKFEIPNIKDAQSNVVVPKCRIHNDASIDISNDGRLLACLVPQDPSSGAFYNSSIDLCIYSIDHSSFGKRLYQWTFGSNALSVSLSPSGRYVVVGLACQRFLHQDAQMVIAQVFKLSNDGFDSLQHIRNITITRSDYMMSLNSIRWLPQSGQGFIYGTNRGSLVIARPLCDMEDQKDKIIWPTSNPTPSSPRSRRFRRFRMETGNPFAPVNPGLANSTGGRVSINGISINGSGSQATSVLDRPLASTSRSSTATQTLISRSTQTTGTQTY